MSRQRHHLADGGPGDELATLAELLDGAAPAGQKRAYRTLRDAVAELDGGDGLPAALAHPDFVLANAVATTDGQMVMVDWARSGARRAPGRWRSCCGASGSAEISSGSTAPLRGTGATCAPRPRS